MIKFSLQLFNGINKFTFKNLKTSIIYLFTSERNLRMNNIIINLFFKLNYFPK